MSSPISPDPPVLAISATFTAEPIQDTLEFWMAELHLPYQVKFAPYAQVFQQLLDPASLLARNRGGIGVVLARLEDWARFQPAIDLERLEENARHLVSCVQSAAAALAAPLVVCLCAESPAFLAGPERAAFARRMAEYLESSLAGLSTVRVITPAQVNRLYPVPGCFDPQSDKLGHIPYTPEYFAALGTMVARKIAALRTPPFKLVALDCDDTLWQGICGEDGPQNVVLDPPRRALQEFMRAQMESGMLLALCSKNNEEDVLETFHLHPEMPLRLEHFVARQLNWEAKSANLISLAQDLELGPDSVILVDDNPEECGEVQADAPEVLTLPLPADPAQIPRFLQHVWAFDRAQVTAEDRARTAMYSERLERSRLEKQASSLEEFIASLNLAIRIAPMTPAQLPRVAQLTQRTNQMNLTTIRRSESELLALLAEGAECLTVDVSDRFGSYGLVGVIIFRTGKQSLDVDTLLLSCRALGRGVEHRMLARLGEIAVERGLATVNVPFAATARNRPAWQFLTGVGAQAGSLPAESAAAVRYRPSGQASACQTLRPAEAGPARIDYLRIANELRDPAAVLQHARKPVRAAAASPAPPQTELQARLAALWAELLRLPSVGIHDSFFDLGGHSLLAVQLLSRVRQEFGADLSLEIVYGGAFTVAELAETIEDSSLLAQLEGLSEEEMQALLAEDDQCESC